jgi:hypothetical protein
MDKYMNSVGYRNPTSGKPAPIETNKSRKIKVYKDRDGFFTPEDMGNGYNKNQDYKNRKTPFFNHWGVRNIFDRNHSNFSSNSEEYLRQQWNNLVNKIKNKRTKTNQKNINFCQK